MKARKKSYLQLIIIILSLLYYPLGQVYFVIEKHCNKYVKFEFIDKSLRKTILSETVCQYILLSIILVDNI